jgi:hypothetical protein
MNTSNIGLFLGNIPFYLLYIRRRLDADGHVHLKAVMLGKILVGRII